jgi:hypothetical protein
MKRGILYGTVTIFAISILWFMLLPLYNQGIGGHFGVSGGVRVSGVVSNHNHNNITNYK